MGRSQDRRKAFPRQQFSNNMTNSFAIRFAVAAVLAFAAQVRGALVVVPNAAATTEGNSFASSVAFTIQTQVAASELTTIPIGSSITGLRWRLEGGAATAPTPSPVVYSDYEITLAQAANSIGALSSTLANNMVNPQLVRDGGLTIPVNSIAGGANPNSFAFVLTFDTPYTYQGGDLIYMLSRPSPTGSSFNTDGVTTGLGLGSVVDGRYTTGFQPTSAASVGFFPAELEFTPVPEPATGACLVGLGLAGVALWRRATRVSPKPTSL